MEPGTKWPPFPDDILKWIVWNENVMILIKISLKFVPRGPINNIPSLVQIMAWCRPGNKPLSEPIMVRLRTHVTRPQWVKTPPHGWQRPVYSSVNTTAADDLVTQGSQASTAIILTKFLQNSMYSAPKGVTHWFLKKIFIFKIECSNWLLWIISGAFLWKNAFRYVSEDLIDDEATMEQEMAWCLRAPSHYLNQCLIIIKINGTSQDLICILFKSVYLFWLKTSTTHI